MGAGTSPAGGTHADGPADEAETSAEARVTEHGQEQPGEDGTRKDATREDGTRKDATREEAEAPEVPAAFAAPEAAGAPEAAAAPETTGASEAPAAPETPGAPETPAAREPAGRSGSTWVPSRRFSLTRDTARPEGGGRAAAGDAPAPARQWPLLTVLCTAGVGLLIVGADPFGNAFRIGTMLMGFALLAGAVMRWVVPSVGMLAVRSRFTDLVTYGLIGLLIVLLALMAQPKPWLDVPFLPDVVHFTIR
ncbi:DUF3017 domain-containing protein [Streptomyces sp. NBC_01012]|uniref:DUF3017 domain-containing protein n=1 Tax=Streptomyces sp. NBC_01012 TaxID=2903717 RepID=UPI003864301E|nr:DUF3017 domain-containing protein [Streptomyces sp. NBC_01012]